MKNFTKTDYKTNIHYRLNHVSGYDIGGPFTATPHCDPCLTIAYFIKADGEIRIGEVSYDIRDGDIILLNSSDMHCTSFKKDSYGERVTIYINGDIAQKFDGASELLHPFFCDDHKIPSDAVHKHGIDKLINEIRMLSDSQDEAKSILATCRITELMLRLKECKKHSDEAIQNATVKNVLQYIDTSFRTIESCDEIAEEFHLSKFHLSRTFKMHIGVSMWDYVIFKRIIYVNEKIKSGDKIEAAAYSAGFSNYSNFFRLYKKHMRMTPKEFKDTL